MFFLSSFACILFEKKRENPPPLISLYPKRIFILHIVSRPYRRKKKRDNTHASSKWRQRIRNLTWSTWAGTWTGTRANKWRKITRCEVLRFIVSSRFVLDWISDIRYYFKKRERLTFFSYSLSLSTVFCHRNTSKSKTTPSAREITPTSWTSITI